MVFSDTTWTVIISALILLVAGLLQYWRDGEELQDQNAKVIFVGLWLLFLVFSVLSVVLSQDLRSQLLGFFGFPFSYGAVVQIYIKSRLRKATSQLKKETQLNDRRIMEETQLNDCFFNGSQRILELSLNQIENPQKWLRGISMETVLPQTSGLSPMRKRAVEKRLEKWTSKAKKFVATAKREEGVSSQSS